MDIKDIYDYLNELARCEWKCNAIENGIRYNGISIELGTETYQRKLTTLQSKAEQTILTLSSTGQTQVLKAVFAKATDIYEQPYDIISQSAVEALKKDFPTNRTPAIKAEIELGQFVVDMHNIQRFHQAKLLSFLWQLLPDEQRIPQTETNERKTDAQKEKESTDKQIIKGVKGLATYMGIGITKAQEILNSGILQKNGIAYRSGKAWRLNAQKLDKMLSDNPAIFRGIQQKDLDL